MKLTADRGDVMELFSKIGLPKLLLIIFCAVFLIVLSIGDFMRAGKSEGKSYEMAQTETETAMETRLCSILCNITGAGRVKAMITLKNEDKNIYTISDDFPLVSGVVIVADGGNNAQVKKEIIEAVQVLFDIEPHKIKVMKLK